MPTIHLEAWLFGAFLTRAGEDARRRGWGAALARWRKNSAARRRLLRCQALDPRFARDIGLDDSEIAMEARRPFWQAVGRAAR